MNLRHVGLATNNLDEMLNFYTAVLGGSIAVISDEDEEFMRKLHGWSAKTTLKTIKIRYSGDSLVELVFYNTGSLGTPNQSSKHHVAFTVSSVQGEYKYLSKLGVKFLSKPLLNVERTHKLCMALDPDGNRVELVEEL